MRITQSLLVSIHLPKTAGTSFHDALHQRYGDGLISDYGDWPMHKRRGIRESRALLSVPRRRRLALAPQVRAVHGHMLPATWRLVALHRPLRFVTCLRDPLQRAVSHYHYWRRDYHGEDPQQPLRNRMLREGWSLERFCLGPEMRNIYRQYLWSFDPNRFDFIGVTERYSELLGWLLGDGTDAGVEAARLVNPERGERYEMDPELERQMRVHHASDLRLYEWVVAGRPGRFRWR